VEKEKAHGRLHLIIPVTNQRHSAACYPWTTWPTLTTTDVTVAITSTATMITVNHIERKAFVWPYFWHYYSLAMCFESFRI